MALPFDLAAELERSLPSHPQTRSDVERVLEDGYIILRDLFTPAELHTARSDLQRLTGDHPKRGRNQFEGHSTVRIYSLLNKSRSFDALCAHPRVLALNEYFLEPGFQLSTFHSISIAPGEKPQLLHHDDSWVKLKRPRVPLGSAILVPLDDSFTDEGGATRIVPASHLWATGQRPTESQTVPAECPAGGAVYFISTTWHGGGGNRSYQPRESVTAQYGQPYMRQIENQYLAIDPRRLKDMPERVVDLLGYRVHPPFIGYVDGFNPMQGASRMAQWLQEPLDPRPPAFMEVPTAAGPTSKL